MSVAAVIRHSQHGAVRAVVLFLIALIAVVAGGGVWWYQVGRQPAQPDALPQAERKDTPPASAARPRPAQRVVSLVPAVTEMLFAIEAGSQVVGVSSYDTYPDAVRQLPRVGALVDPDVERVLSLEPDLVVTYGSQEELQQQLVRAGIAAFDYRHGGVGHALDTMRTLGARTGHAREAVRETTRISTALAAITQRVAGRKRPRTLLVIGREPLAMRGIYVSAGKGFLHELLTLAGGDDVMGDIPRESVQATTETILARAPEVILEVRSGPKPDATTIDRERRAWSRLSGVPAVRSGRVYLLYDNALVVPGPRMPLAAEQFARVMHPEAFP
ncbi:MAG: ABC transporter substrate-binding protein [Luteitalea sp.]|nr:ABC transporter substrate-binding protein [Luteitalea sp.]